MSKQISSAMVRLLRGIEIIISIILLIAIVIAVILACIDSFGTLSTNQFDLELFLGSILTLVVSVEFVKMLILHTPQSVIEVLLYAVARQIIISHENAMENLIGVLAIAIIFVIRKFLFDSSFIEQNKE